MNDTIPMIILVVDDEPMIADVISAYLEKAGYTVVRASTGRTALEAYTRYKPALVILD
ncbi:MAG TPA: DNA-binding response regulator, partial [Clostridiales bacterium]|nr:DNA-binding response regulator [Clostridiales bacterium]